MKTAKLTVTEPAEELVSPQGTATPKQNGSAHSLNHAPKYDADNAKTIGKLNSKVNILLVDDRKDKLLALSAILTPLGQNIMEAHSGKDALRLVLKNEF